MEFPQEHRKATLSGTDMQTRDDAGTVLSASNGNTWGVPAGLCSDDCLSEWQVCPWPLTVQESPLPSSHQAADNLASRTPERQGWGEQGCGDNREDRLSHQGNTSLQGPCPDGSHFETCPGHRAPTSQEFSRSLAIPPTGTALCDLTDS